MQVFIFMKKIIISGSSSGIGRAIAQKLLQLNYQVIGLARNHQKFVPGSPNYLPYAIDFSDLKNAESILKSICQEHPQVETIIGNAGYGRFGMLEQFSLQQITDLLNVNFLGQALLVKNFLPLMKQRQAGKIIFIGSEASLAGAKEGSIYCASKFALRGFAQSLRAECRHAGIGVTLVNPGLAATPFFDNLHFSPGSAPENSLQPEDIAETIAHLVQLPDHCLVEELNLQPLKPAIHFTQK